MEMECEKIKTHLCVEPAGLAAMRFMPATAGSSISVAGSVSPPVSGRTCVSSPRAACLSEWNWEIDVSIVSTDGIEKNNIHSK